MKASEGKLGRVFMLRLEEGDDPAATIERFAAEKRIVTAQVFLVAESALAGIIVADADGKPCLRLPERMSGGGSLAEGDVIIQEVTGIALRRVVDPASGRTTVARIAGTKTRVMEKAAPEPDVAGPGTVPVYLFNAEFN